MLRTLWRNKSYAFLNLFGLTFGLVAFLLIILYVQHEYSFDQYHENKDRIYRVAKQEIDDFYMGSDHFAVTPAPLAPALMANYPEVELAARIFYRLEVVIGVDHQSYLEPYVFGVDQETFDIFSFEVKSGSKKDFLQNKYSAIITESLAKKYFGEADPVGQTIQFRNEHPFTIGGVIADMPKNSHFQMDLMLHFESMAEVEQRALTNWNNSSFYTYFLLQEGINPASLEDKLPALLVENGVNKKDEEATSRFYFEEFSKIHLYSNINFDIAPTKDAKQLQIYLLVAFLILIIAVINYINLSTAKAFKRAKEVGIRKTVGAYQSNLIIQFLSESFFLSFVALMFALIVVELALPAYSHFLGEVLSLDFGLQNWLTPFLILLWLVLGLFSGIYPAFVLSSFKPQLVLKGIKAVGSRKSWLRNTLVVSQFAVSAALIISTLIISRQLNFIQNKDMGYSRDQILIVNVRDQQLKEKLPVFKEELVKINGVDKVAIGSSMPNKISSNSGARWPGKPQEVDLMFYTGLADYDYVEIFDLELIEGRDFDRAFGNENKSVLLNESAVKALGWEEPIGKHLITWKGDTASVVGVLKDFHQHSLHLEIAPLQLFFEEKEDLLAVKINSDDIPATIATIEDTHQQMTGGTPFEYKFFDEVFEQAYHTEIKTAAMANWFTGLLIFIACLGLYGLSAFTTELRIKEVGIRKILGASTATILILLSKDFLKLIVLAFLIAIPLAYHVMQGWLNNFAYHINIGFTIFFWTLICMIGISLLTVGFKTFKAAANKPVDALRQE